jgi:hypothetical protein
MLQMYWPNAILKFRLQKPQLRFSPLMFFFGFDDISLYSYRAYIKFYISQVKTRGMYFADFALSMSLLRFGSYFILMKLPWIRAKCLRIW